MWQPYVKNEQFDVHLTLVVKCFTLNYLQSKGKVKNYYLGYSITLYVVSRSWIFNIIIK